jgi:hypothetical protein
MTVILIYRDTGSGLQALSVQTCCQFFSASPSKGLLENNSTWLWW